MQPCLGSGSCKVGTLRCLDSPDPDIVSGPGPFICACNAGRGRMTIRPGLLCPMHLDPLVEFYSETKPASVERTNISSARLRRPCWPMSWCETATLTLTSGLDPDVGAGQVEELTIEHERGLCSFLEAAGAGKAR